MLRLLLAATASRTTRDGEPSDAVGGPVGTSPGLARQSAFNLAARLPVPVTEFPLYGILHACSLRVPSRTGYASDRTSSNGSRTHQVRSAAEPAIHVIPET